MLTKNELRFLSDRPLSYFSNTLFIDVIDKDNNVVDVLNAMFVVDDYHTDITEREHAGDDEYDTNPTYLSVMSSKFNFDTDSYVGDDYDHLGSVNDALQNCLYDYIEFLNEERSDLGQVAFSLKPNS